MHFLRTCQHTVRPKACAWSLPATCEDRAVSAITYKAIKSNASSQASFGTAYVCVHVRVHHTVCAWQWDNGCWVAGLQKAHFSEVHCTVHRSTLLGPINLTLSRHEHRDPLHTSLYFKSTGCIALACPGTRSFSMSTALSSKRAENQGSTYMPGCCVCACLY